MVRLNSDGTLDTQHFGNAGKVIVDFDGSDRFETVPDLGPFEQLTGVAIDDAGRIVVTGPTFDPAYDEAIHPMGVMRLCEDGSIDDKLEGCDGPVGPLTGFSIGDGVDGNGKKIVPFANSCIGNPPVPEVWRFNYPSDIWIQNKDQDRTNDKYLISAAVKKREDAAGFHFGVGRMNVDGAMDSDFGQSVPSCSGKMGTRLIEIGMSAEPSSLVATTDDLSIFVAGTTISPSEEVDMAVAKLDHRGELVAFGNSGIHGVSVIDFQPGAADQAADIMLQPVGLQIRIVVVGKTTAGATAPTATISPLHALRLTASSMTLTSPRMVKLFWMQAMSFRLVVRRPGLLCTTARSLSLETRWET